MARQPSSTGTAKLLQVLAIISSILIARASAAGFIQCLDGALDGGVGNVPIHNFIYSFDNGQVFISGAANENCGEMRGVSSFGNQYMKCLGNEGGSESAAFWITSDGCYNIESGGNHMFCCGVNGAGSCTTS